MFSTHRLFSRLTCLLVLAWFGASQGQAAGDAGATALFAGPKANTAFSAVTTMTSPACVP